MKRAGAGIAPIFAQQSIREMKRTGRTPRGGYGCRRCRHASRPIGTDQIGADADHLKTRADVDATSAAGFTFYTIDPSDHVDGNADDYDEPMLRERFAPLRIEVRMVRGLYRSHGCRCPMADRSRSTKRRRCAVR